MAARFWVGGTGNWDASTTTHWSTTSGGGSGAAVPTSSDDVTFDSNSGTSATVTITAAANANSITLNKSDLTLTHNAGSTVVGTVTLTTGTLNTNGQTCSWGVLSSVNSNARTITLGSSAISLTATTGTVAIAISTHVSLTWSSNTATITMNGIAPQISTGGSFNFNGTSLVFGGSGAPDLGACTCANLTRNGTAVKTDRLLLSGSVTVTGTLTLNGNNSVNRLLIETVTPGTNFTLTAATVSVTNADFMDITGAGTGNWNLSAITGLSGDCGGNSGITFTTPATQTWSGNTTGNWTGPANWTSRVPLPQDNVIINGLTSGTITASMPRLGANINCTSSTGGTLSFSGSPSTCYGNFTWASGMTDAGSGFTLAGRGSQTYTSAGTTRAGTMNITAPGGTYTFQDNFNCASSVSLTAGTWTAVNTNVTATAFNLTASTINMGSGTWTATGTGAVWNTTTGLVQNAQTSTLVISDTSSTSKSIGSTGTGYTYNTLTITGDNVTIVLSNTIANLNLNNAGLPNGFKLPTSGGTQTITNSFTTNGSAGNLVKLSSNSPGTPAPINKASGVISVDYMSITDSTAGGGATWYAGTHSTNGGDNSGWIFTAPPNGNEFFAFM